MAETDFFVAVHGQSSAETTFKHARRYCSSTKQELVQQLVSEKTSNLLVMAVVDDITKGKQIRKDVFTQFAENVVTPAGAYTQFALYFADDASGDLIQYRCERLTDIDAVVEEEGGKHLCSMACATTVIPNAVSFDFIDTRLTLMVCTDRHYEVDSLVRLAMTATDAMACRAWSICVLVPSTEFLSHTPEGLGAAVEAVRVACKNKPFGRDERASSRARLQDVRAWAQSVNEQFRFSPAAPGPYFVSLNPQFVVGEKLIHAIPEEVTYLVGEGTVASAWDFVALSAAAEKSVLHPSVYSPHCRIRREGHNVWLKPECGMTYVNGHLLKEESALENNDRVIVGKQLAFRFVLATSTAPSSPSSRILDWELCSKEFRQQSETKLAKGERNQYELDNKDLRERVALLEKQLTDVHGDSWLIMNNPPSSNYTGSFMWPLNLLGSGEGSDEVVIGPKGPGITIPCLTNSASLKRERTSLVFRCGSVTIPLSHGSRFTIGSHSFTVCLSPEVAPKVTNGTKLGSELNGENDEVRALRLSCFDLQWAIALLFDFAFPPDAVSDNGVMLEDIYREYRKDICRDSIMTSDADFAVSQLTALNEQLTGAVRMIGAGMAKEVNKAYIGFPERDGVAKARSRNEGSVSAAPAEFFQKVTSARELSSELLKRYHAEAGQLLMEINASTSVAQNDSTPASKKETPKKGKNGGKHGSESRPSSARADGQVQRLTNLSVLSSASAAARASGSAEDLFEVRLTRIKGFAFLASPQVVRCARNTVDVLGVSPNPKSLWEKYLKVLAVIPVPEGSLVMRQNYFLAILDVIIASEFCLTRGLFAKREINQLESKMDQWQDLLIKFACSFDEPGQQKRSAWRHEAAFQKGATPRLQPAAVKAPRAAQGSTAGTSSAGVSPPKGARRNSSATPSARRSGSKEPPLGKPKNRSASASISAGRTPPNLSTFGGAPKSPRTAANGKPRGGKLMASTSSVASHGSLRRPTNQASRGHSPRSTDSTPRVGIPSPATSSPRASNANTVRHDRKGDGGVKPKRKPEGVRALAFPSAKK